MYSLELRSCEVDIINLVSSADVATSLLHVLLYTVDMILLVWLLRSRLEDTRTLK